MLVGTVWAGVLTSPSSAHGPSSDADVRSPVQCGPLQLPPPSPPSPVWPGTRPPVSRPCVGGGGGGLVPFVQPGQRGETQTTAVRTACEAGGHVQQTISAGTDAPRNHTPARLSSSSVLHRRQREPISCGCTSGPGLYWSVAIMPRRHTQRTTTTTLTRLAVSLSTLQVHMDCPRACDAHRKLATFGSHETHPSNNNHPVGY